MSHSKIMIEDSIINKLFKNLYNLNSCAKRELLFFLYSRFSKAHAKESVNDNTIVFIDFYDKASSIRIRNNDTEAFKLTYVGYYNQHEIRILRLMDGFDIFIGENELYNKMRYINSKSILDGN